MGSQIVLEDSNNHKVGITPKDGATGDRTVTIPDSVPDLDTANTFGGNVEAPSMTIGGEVVYNESNILGAVSQVGGVPTGAIIEQGSNANGEYIKYADGTLICKYMSQTIYTPNLAHGAIFYINISLLTFPATFSIAPTLIPTSFDVNGIVQCAPYGTLSTTVCNLRCLSFQNTSTGKVGYLAVGRWY